MIDEQEQAKTYQNLVLQYEEIGTKIQSLIRLNGGHTENMSEKDRHAYRQLANQRDDLYNQIKAIEATWLETDAP